MKIHKYHRTLNEAFPFGAHYGCAIEKPHPKNHKGIVLVAAFCIILMVAVAAIAS